MINLDVDKGKALLLGASILGCGGGGSPSLGLKIIKDSLEKGIKLQIKGLDEFPSGGYLAQRKKTYTLDTVFNVTIEKK